MREAAKEKQQPQAPTLCSLKLAADSKQWPETTMTMLPMTRHA